MIIYEKHNISEVDIKNIKYSGDGFTLYLISDRMIKLTWEEAQKVAQHMSTYWDHHLQEIREAMQKTEEVKEEYKEQGEKD